MDRSGSGGSAGLTSDGPSGVAVKEYHEQRGDPVKHKNSSSFPYARHAVYRQEKLRNFSVDNGAHGLRIGSVRSSSSAGFLREKTEGVCNCPIYGSVEPLTMPLPSEEEPLPMQPISNFIMV